MFGPVQVVFDLCVFSADVARGLSFLWSLSTLHPLTRDLLIWSASAAAAAAGMCERVMDPPGDTCVMKCYVHKVSLK